MTAPRIVSRSSFPPQIQAVADEAMEDFTNSRRFVCRHVASGAQVVMLCAQHPKLGIRCHVCMPAHVERHDHAAEHTCDVCGLVTEDIYGVGFSFYGIDVNVQQARGQKGSITGTVGVIGLGICGHCAGEEER